MKQSKHSSLCFTSGAPVVTGSCSAWRSWSRVCSLWCYGWPTLSNCCTSSSVTSLSCCPGGGTRRTKVDCSTSHSGQACSVSKCVFKMWVCVVRSAGLGGVLHSDSLWGSHDGPGGSHHVHLPAVRLLSNKGQLPHIDYTFTQWHQRVPHPFDP